MVTYAEHLLEKEESELEKFETDKCHKGRHETNIMNIRQAEALFKRVTILRNFFPDLVEQASNPVVEDEDTTN
jgi:hypothetical protein